MIVVIKKYVLNHAFRVKETNQKNQFKPVSQSKLFYKSVMMNLISVSNDKHI